MRCSTSTGPCSLPISPAPSGASVTSRLSRVNRPWPTSCQAKRAALVAEKLLADVLAPVPHRHLIFTIPKVLRGVFQRERRLLSMLTRSAYDAVRITWATGCEDRCVLPGLVISIQTFGS